MNGHISDDGDTEAMFSRIARHYDLFNRLASLNLAYYWRRKTAATACPDKISDALDICCGTGDMAFALAKTGNVEKITGLDASRAMLACAEKKQGKIKTPFDWLCAPATQTNLDCEAFDLITCAFGLRNIPDKTAALKEMHRLLKKGGRVCILEFSIPDSFLLRRICLLYLRFAVPLIGRLLLGSGGPADYLARSIRDWDRTIVPKEMLTAAGFKEVRTLPLTGGIVSVHTGVK